jgi:outer membrane immunogenic protein
MLGGAFAADVNVPLKAPEAPPLGFNWSGFYIGANAGFATSSHTANSFTDTGPFSGSLSYKESGGFGGGQVGYNWVLSPGWLLGIEIDADGAGINGNVSGCTAIGCSASHVTTDAFGTFRGRLGYMWAICFCTERAVWCGKRANPPVPSFVRL